jgi:hypothetical protein
LIKMYWIQIEPSKILVILNLVAKQKSSLITECIKELIIDKIEENQSKFRYNVELKNNLFNFFEFISGDEGKIYLNKRLGFLWY